MPSNLTLFTIAPTESIRAAMAKIERNKSRAVVVIDPTMHVLGVVSDGDIRRAFLHDVLPIAPVSQIMQLNPRVSSEVDPQRRHEEAQRRRVTVLPIVDTENRLVDIEIAYEPFVD
jgi:CBS domain-containing protein